MLCKEIMKKDVKFVMGADDVRSAARKMKEHGIGFLPVCDDSRVIGTLTDRDIAVRLVADGLPESTKVSEVMTCEAVTCSPDDDLRMAEDRMAAEHKSRIMCIDGAGNLKGVISLSDIAEQDDEAHAGTTIRRIAEREAHA